MWVCLIDYIQIYLISYAPEFTMKKPVKQEQKHYHLYILQNAHVSLVFIAKCPQCSQQLVLTIYIVMLLCVFYDFLVLVFITITTTSTRVG